MAKTSEVKLDLDGELMPKGFCKDSFEEVRNSNGHYIFDKYTGGRISMKCPTTKKWCSGTAGPFKPFSCAGCDNYENWLCGKFDNVFAKDNSSNESETQQKIRDITNAIQDLLLYKNKMYGDSALNPNNIYYKGNSTNSILIRIDDKIGRIKNNPDKTPRVNDTLDVIGYQILLLISMGVTAEDIAKFKD